MTSNDNQHIKKSVVEPSSEMIVKAINYPPGYPENEQKCNKNEEKHKNCHPMHCHHMQPMQSTTMASIIDTTPDHAQQISKK